MQDSDIFIGFQAIESETDDCPFGETRKHYNAKYLEELDQKRNDYMNRVADDIIEDCRSLITSLSGEAI